MKEVIGVLMAVGAVCAHAGEPREITITSSADGSAQPAIFYAPASTDAVPLVVTLHPWSANYRKINDIISRWCMENDWAYMNPDFRGPNKRPEAAGSDLAVQDIVDAVNYARKATRIDDASIYLVGASGGGHAALLMAGRHPEIWSGVSAWVPISDLGAWYDQGKYRNDIVASCGGVPGASEAVDEEYRRRSPLTCLADAGGVVLHINAGIHDGHRGSVPISHSLLAFNEVARPGDRFSEEEIRHFVEKEEVPPGLRVDVVDPSYGDKEPLFRRTSGNATITIFDGGHEILSGAAVAWIRSIHGGTDAAAEPAADEER